MTLENSVEEVWRDEPSQQEAGGRYKTLEKGGLLQCGQEVAFLCSSQVSKPLECAFRAYLPANNLNGPKSRNASGREGLNGELSCRRAQNKLFSAVFQPEFWRITNCMDDGGCLLQQSEGSGWQPAPQGGKMKGEDQNVLLAPLQAS